jgi:hypothetical protein
MPKLNMPSKFTFEGLISRNMLEENIKMDDRETGRGEASM